MAGGAALRVSDESYSTVLDCTLTIRNNNSLSFVSSLDL